MKKLMISLSLLLMSSLAFAKAKTAIQCVGDPADAYSIGVVMPSGPHRGQCIDTQAKRSIQILKHDEKGLWISNFRYQGQFWNAFIPNQSVDSVEFVFVDLNVRQLSRLGVNVFHTHLRFKFKPESPLFLLSQFAPQYQKTAKLNDIIVSMNYMAPKGVDYNPVKGFISSEYLSAIQVYATSDEALTRAMGHNNMFGIKLDLNQDQAWRVLMAGLARSQQEGYSVSYDTWDSNCTLEAFNILDQALHREYHVAVEPFKFSVLDIRDMNFMPALDALQERGLIHDQNDVTLLNTEFGYTRFASSWKKF